ncbi:class I SAM-dependent methyltransferase [Myxacorys almedinensis]|uniref:Methyltransferase domain-containing protein n=1 Tax=Myxacorys almedinensis A TaxID=2690445 RepID=A0A8J8CHF8_9CYAN|nr:class I SAM-dependent methyltransferase [Myxacorys almedinensis]NDJ16609.1 methyltransferase domain-containing protein [Myxacorys almedinensis A]
MTNLYARWLFPRLMDLAMSGDELSQYRRDVLANVKGTILEIGFGTGLNLQHYPASVHAITTVDVNPGMSTIAQRRIRASAIAVNHQVVNGESLPLPDQSFDSVVSTWTLCSIANLDQALQEIYRVLKPDGAFYFIEHGLSRDPNIQVWQHRLTPVQKLIADGCHLDRDIQHLVEKQFGQVTVTQFPAKGLPAIAGYLYQGIARKTDAAAEK